MSKMYLLESAIVLTCFWLSYYFIFRKMQWLVFNRIVLFFGISLSILIPFINVNDLLLLIWPGLNDKLPAMPSIFANAGDVSSHTSIPLKTPFTDIDLFSSFYLTITTILLIRLLLKIITILKLIKGTQHRASEGITFCSGEAVSENFSFFKYVFVPVGHSSTDVTYILQHEKAHVHQLHSVDVLLTEVYVAIFWINPVSWLYKIFIKENHEFLADAAVVSKMTAFEKNNYKIMILESQISNQYPQVVNTFNFSPYKTRINMIDKNQVTLKAKMCYVGSVCLILILITFGKAFSNHSAKVLYDTLDKKPTYTQGKDQLMKYLMNTIRYPKAARQSQTQGIFIVTFLVDEKGRVKDARMVKEMPTEAVPVNEVVVVGYGTSESTLDKSPEGKSAIENEVTHLVSQLGNFNPGTIKGNPVEVQMAIPFKFRIKP